MSGCYNYYSVSKKRTLLKTNGRVQRFAEDCHGDFFLFIKLTKTNISLLTKTTSNSANEIVTKAFSI